MKHIERIKGKPIQELPVVFVGNKLDLEAERQVTTWAGFVKAKRWNASFIETSALKGANVDACFELLVLEWHKKITFTN